MSVWSELEDNADFTTFQRAKDDRKKLIELGCGPNAFRFVKTDKHTYEYALGVMPPACQGGRGFLMGEPALHNADGEPVYYGFFDHNGSYSCSLLTVNQFKDIHRPMIDYRGEVVQVGDYVKNIESGWKGLVRDTEGQGCDLMLVCFGVNWFDGTIDEDDKQWHSPADVIKVDDRPEQSPNPLNFL